MRHLFRRRGWVRCVGLSWLILAWRECEDGRYDSSRDHDLLAMYSGGGEL